MVNTASNGELLGVRVRWSIKSEYLGCQFTTLRVELNNNEVGKDVSVNGTFKDFSEAGGDHLDCNRQYRPRVRAVNISNIPKSDYGAPLFYSSKINSQIKQC